MCIFGMGYDYFTTMNKNLVLKLKTLKIKILDNNNF